MVVGCLVCCCFACCRLLVVDLFVLVLVMLFDVVSRGFDLLIVCNSVVAILFVLICC